MTTQDIFTLIKADHREIDKLFKKIDRTSERATKTRTRLFEQLRDKIVEHSHAEEEAVYPLLRKHTKTEDIGYESVEEHSVISHLLDRISVVAVSEKEWTAAVTVLKEMIQHHVEEEQSEMFAKMRRTFSKNVLTAMAQDFLRSKESFLQRVVDVLMPVEPTAWNRVA